MTEKAAGSKDVTSRESGVAKQREPETVLRPPVDIFENSEGITLRADMPGVSREHLSIQVDNDSLTVEGDAMIDMPDDMEALYADIRSTRYRRSFALSSELDTDRIDASLRDGVLNLRIPKRAEVQPRKSEIRTG